MAACGRGLRKPQAHPHLLHPDLQGVRRLFDRTDEWTKVARAVGLVLRGPSHAI